MGLAVIYSRVSKEWDPDTLFDVFGDRLARHVLVLASEGPLSAEDLAEHCDASLPTIYRRVDSLEELDLLQARMHVDSDGNQYRQFETALKRVGFAFDSGGIDVEVGLRRDLSDRFEAFWDELERTSERELDADAARSDEPRGDPRSG